MRVRVDVGIFDGDRPQVRVRDKLDVRNHPDSDTFFDRKPHGFSAANFHHDTGGDSRYGQGVLEGKARRRADLTEHYRLVLKFLYADSPSLPPRMAAVDESDHRMAAVWHRQQSFVALDIGQHRNIDLKIEKQIQHLAGVACSNRQLDSGIALVKSAEHLDGVKRLHGAHFEGSGMEPAGSQQKSCGFRLQAHDPL